MAAREWFTEKNTPSDVHRATLNRAARLLAGPGDTPLSRAELVALRCAYRPELTAAEIAEAADEALAVH